MGKAKRFTIGLVVMAAGFGLRYMFTYVTAAIGSGTTALPLNLDDIIQTFSLVFIVLGIGIMVLVLTKVVYRKIREMIAKHGSQEEMSRKPYSERIQERRRGNEKERQ